MDYPVCTRRCDHLGHYQYAGIRVVLGYGTGGANQCAMTARLGAVGEERTMAAKRMSLWKYPKDYLGASWENYYVVLGQHRDSDTVTRSNFAVAKEELEKLADKYPDFSAVDKRGEEESMVVTPQASHWAVGWVEFLGIHKDAPQEVIDAGDAILAKLEDYPILDEDYQSELECSEISEYYDSLSIRMRWDYYLKEEGFPIFAARHTLSKLMDLYDTSDLYDKLRS